MLEALMLTWLAMGDVVAPQATVARPTDAQAAPILETVGSAQYNLGPFRLYHAELRAPNGRFSWAAPFELALYYERSFTAERIADASLSEMRRLTGEDMPASNILRTTLIDCFGDVVPGDQITGRSLDTDTTVFLRNGAQSCRIEDARFRKAFFAIWLDPNARRPKSATRLLGGAPFSSPPPIDSPS